MKNSFKALCGVACLLLSFGESEGMEIKLGYGNNSQSPNLQTPSDDEDDRQNLYNLLPMNLNTQLRTPQQRRATLDQLYRRESNPMDYDDLLQIREEIAYLQERWRQQEQILQTYTRNKTRIRAISADPERRSELDRLTAENNRLANNYPRLIFSY